MPVSEQTYLRLVQEDPDSKWELHCGRLWSKEPMTWEYIKLASVLGFWLQQQLPLDQFIVVEQAGQVRRSETQYYIPDVLVVPAAMVERLFPQRGMVAVFPDPLPLVVEIWSPSTGRLDVVDKLPEYQGRGDREVWLIHPYERWLRARVRQPDGSYSETLYQGGAVSRAYLPNVTIDLDALFQG